MKRIPLSRSLPLWILLALAPPAHGETAPRPAEPHAWVLSLHVGGGNLTMEGDSLGRDSGIMTHLRLGHIVAPGVIAGFQARGWGATKSGLDRQLQIITVTAAAYPVGRGFYVRVGAGVCAARQQFLFYAPPVPPDTLGAAPVPVWRQDGGFASTAAAGFDVRIRPAIALGIDVEYARVVAAHIGGHLITYTAGLNAHW